MPKAVNISGAAGTVQVINGARTLYGFSVRESNAVAAAATVAVRDAIAGAAAADLVASTALAANGSKTVRYPKGVKVAAGIRVLITGTIEGSVYVD